LVIEAIRKSASARHRTPACDIRFSERSLIQDAVTRGGDGDDAGHVPRVTAADSFSSSDADASCVAPPERAAWRGWRT
jgi:hypothetical protein